MRLHGWAVVCDEAGVKVEYLNCDNGTHVVFHRNDPFAESTSSEEFASGSQAVRKQFANDNENVSSNPLRYQQSAESGTASQRAWYPG